MIPTELHSSALAGAEALINRALEYDPATRTQLGQLAGKVIAVEITAPPLSVYIACHSERLSLHSEWDETADVSLKGNAIALAGIALRGEEQGSVAGSGVEVRGNLDVLQTLRDILGNLDVDWEAALAELVGDVPAHLLAQAVRSTYRWQLDARRRMTEVAVNYVRDEAMLTPARPEVEQFAAQVRHLAADVERLAARVNRIKRTVAGD